MMRDAWLDANDRAWALFAFHLCCVHLGDFVMARKVLLFTTGFVSAGLAGVGPVRGN